MTTIICNYLGTHHHPLTSKINLHPDLTKSVNEGVNDIARLLKENYQTSPKFNTSKYIPKGKVTMHNFKVTAKDTMTGNNREVFIMAIDYNQAISKFIELYGRGLVVQSCVEHS